METLLIDAEEMCKRLGVNKETFRRSWRRWKHERVGAGTTCAPCASTGVMGRSRQRATMAVSKYRTKSGIRWAADVWQDGIRIGRKAGFTSKRAATAWEETILTSPPKPADLALRDVCTRHLLYCENRLKPNTLSYKTTAYRRFIAFAGGDTSFRSITKHAIDKFVDELARIISKKTANKHKTELSSLWAWANKEGLVQGNPPQQIDSYAVKKTVKYIPPSVDIAKLLNIADEGFEKDFLVCLLHTAARISEIRNMAWEDVDLPHRTVTLWTSKRRGGNSEPRKIAMSETLYELLEKLNGQRTGAEAYVFTDPKTGTAYTRTCNKIKFFMGNLCARAGVAHFFRPQLAPLHGHAL